MLYDLDLFFWDCLLQLYFWFWTDFVFNNLKMVTVRWLQFPLVLQKHYKQDQVLARWTSEAIKALLSWVSYQKIRVCASKFCSSPVLSLRPGSFSIHLIETTITWWIYAWWIKTEHNDFPKYHLLQQLCRQKFNSSRFHPQLFPTDISESVLPGVYSQNSHYFHIIFKIKINQICCCFVANSTCLHTKFTT